MQHSAELVSPKDQDNITPFTRRIEEERLGRMINPGAEDIGYSWRASATPAELLRVSGTPLRYLDNFFFRAVCFSFLQGW